MSTFHRPLEIPSCENQELWFTIVSHMIKRVTISVSIFLSLLERSRICDDAHIHVGAAGTCHFGFLDSFLSFGVKWPLEINSRFICRIYYRCRCNKYEYLSLRNFGNSFSYLRLLLNGRMSLVCGYRLTICFAYIGREKSCQRGRARGWEIIAHIPLCLASVQLTFRLHIIARRRNTTFTYSVL